MRKWRCMLTVTVLLMLTMLCSAADAGIPEKIEIPEGVEIPEGIENPEDPVELGSWGIPFTVPGDSTRYIYAHTEDGVLIGLALFAPEDPDAEAMEIPEGMETIVPGFFEQMPRIRRVRIPESVCVLTMESFAGIRRDFVIECVPGSYAEAFALEYGFQYDSGERQAVGWEITDPEEKVRWVAANYLREDMTGREKAWRLHNWLITNSHYHSEDEGVSVYESDTILTKGYGVCEAYAFAYYRLLKEAGMAAAVFTGDSVPASSAAHDWNLVRIDGQWYHVDCTWDDPGSGPEDVPCVSGQENSRYFLKTDAEMAADHSWDSEYSADRGRMFSFYDPELGQEVFRSSWDVDFTYEPDPEWR